MVYNQQPPPNYSTNPFQGGQGDSWQNQQNSQYNGNYQQAYYEESQTPLNQNHMGFGGPELEKPPDVYTGKPEAGAGTFDEAFKVEKPRYNDWWASILFLGFVAAFITLAVMGINAYRETHSFQGEGIYGNPNTGGLNTNAILLLVFVGVIAFGFSLIMLIVARTLPRGFIIVSLFGNVCVGIGLAIWYFVDGFITGGVIFLVISLFSAWCYYSMRSRIPFAVAVLKTVIDGMKDCNSVLFTSFIGGIVSLAFTCLLSVSIVGLYIKYDPNQGNPGCSVGTGGSCSQSKLVGLLILLFFCGFFISEVIMNVVHVTVSGVYGVWYYCSKSDQGMPRWPALGAFRRAMTYSFGSICFGSFLVSLVKLIRLLVNAARNSAADDGNFIASCFLLIAECFISCIEWAFRYFNHYAYSYIALYGKPYVRSAKDTWAILKHKGIDALVNDCFIDTALSFASVFIGFVSGLFAYLYLHFTKPAYNEGGEYNVALVAFSFLIAVQFCRIVTSSLQSGTATFFIALAMDPEVFRLSYPDRFEEIFRAYPDVMRRVLTSANAGRANV